MPIKSLKILRNVSLGSETLTNCRHLTSFVQRKSKLERMGSINEMEEFTEIRRRRSSGGKKTPRGKHAYSAQRMNRRRYAGAPTPPTRCESTGSGGSRRSSTASSASSTSDGSLDVAKEMDDPENEPAICLGMEGLETGLVLEMLILEALVNHPEMSLFKTHGGQSQLEFTNPEGDVLTWLNVARQWVAQLQSGTIDTWYQKYHIQESTLRNIEKHVEKRRKFLVAKSGRRISLAFGKDIQISNEIISNILVNRFCENICVYHGHPSLGYKVLSTGDTVYIHPSSSVCFLTRYPNYIMYVDIPNNITKQVKAVMVLNEGLAISILDFNSKANDFVKENVAKPCKFDNIGESISIELESFWNGVNSYHGESLEDILKFHCNNTPLLFERNSKSNTVLVYSLPEYHETIRIMVGDEIKKIQNKFKNECFEFGYPDEKSGLRLLMGPGAGNERFLFAHDFRSVWIHETKESALTKEFVQNEMEKYGQVADVHVSEKKNKEDSGIWGTVTFRDPATVIKLLSSKSHDASMLIELAPNTGNNMQLSKAKISVNRTVKVQLKLCRRPSKSGLAFVKIKGRRDFGIALNTKNMTIGKDRVKFSIRPGKPEDIQLSGLGSIVETKDISDALIAKLGITPSHIEIDRTPSFSSTADDLHKFKTSLQRIVDKSTDVSKVGIRVFMPNPDDLYLKAEVKFPTRRIAESAMVFINGAKIRGLSIQIANNPLNDPEVPSVVIRVENDAYQSVRNEVKKQLSRVPPGVTVTLSSDEDSQEMKIFSQNTIEAEHVASKLQELLLPLEVKLSKKKVEHLTKDGEAALNTTMDETKTLIDVVQELRMISIYGSKSRVLKARKAILDYFDQINTGGENEAMYRISFNGPNKPPALMVEVMNGMKAGLLERTGVKNLKIDIKSRALCYSGSVEAHVTIQTMIDSMCEYLGPSLVTPTVPTEHPEDDEIPECSACYCPIEGAQYSLQACGHQYCEECVDTHVKVSLENKGFPITCVDESCGQPLCVRDIVILSRKLNRGLLNVLKISADHYVQTRPKEFGFCHKPNCRGVFQKRADAIAYCCSLCAVKICPKCHNNFHGAESCEDYLGNTTFRLWMAGSKDRKKCPNCRMAIEKIDGCNRVQCTNCQRQICWKCLEHFADMRLAYDHLNREHNGYM